jgi:hypothetical protein
MYRTAKQKIRNYADLHGIDLNNNFPPGELSRLSSILNIPYDELKYIVKFFRRKQKGYAKSPPKQKPIVFKPIFQTGKEKKKMRNVKYRGISGVIRRGIISGRLTGIITPENVRGYLPAIKSDAPDDTIIKSMKHLEKKGELATLNGQFCTKQYYRNQTVSQNKPKETEYSLIGKLVDTKAVNGKTVMTFEVSSFMMK